MDAGGAFCIKQRGHREGAANIAIQRRGIAKLGFEV